MRETVMSKEEKITRNNSPYVDNEMNIKMKKWFDRGYNVMFRGLHGIGKTVSSINFLEKNKIKYKYFSCSTLNPWLHFIGLPKEKAHENGELYIDYILPEGFDNNIEVIILDEFNRARKEVKNAVMELLQFKSINGRKFDNLKMIIACCNPHFDDKDRPEFLEYDVESIDPAQEDRFQIQIDMPYKPNKKYLSHVYNKEIAERAVSWWETLTLEQKYSVSPRRLDLMLDYYYSGEDVGEMVKEDIKKSFINNAVMISDESILSKMNACFEKNNTKKGSELFKSDTRVFNLLKQYSSDNKLWNEIKNKVEWVLFWFRCMPVEYFSTLFYEQSNIRKMVLSGEKTIEYIPFLVTYCNFNKSSPDPQIKTIIRIFESIASSDPQVYSKITEFESENPSLSYFNKRD